MQEPRNADAWACLASLYLDEDRHGFNARPEPLPRALDAARRAIGIDPTSANAHRALAEVHFFRGDRDGFQPAADRAIALNRRDGATVAMLVIMTLLFAFMLVSFLRLKSRGDEVINRWQPAYSVSQDLLSDLVNQAQSIASSQLGAGSTADERAAQAQIVNSLLQQALDLSNRRYQGQAIFGGQNGAVTPFVAVGGGYQYQGTAAGQGILTPAGGAIDYSLSGDTAFGAVSSQVVGYRNLAPALTAGTRLADLGGATLAGVPTGPVAVTVGGTTTTVDLSQAATVGDVVTLLNAGLTAAGSTASVAIAGGALAVTGDATQAVTIADAQGGKTAASLGLATTVAAGATAAGAALSPRITATTPLAALNGGAGLDPRRAPVLLSLHSAAIYIGSSFGAALGGIVLGRAGYAALGPAGASIIVIALATIAISPLLRASARPALA